jgi:SAM-dependent methyltransferase
MYEAIKRLLRGRHNSIRYKYGTLPKEWLAYFSYRLRGKSWADFYAQRLDGYIDVSQAKMPSERYLEQGIGHFEYLKKQGLKPEHMFLDYGCGVMRLGAFVGKYLDPGNYVGVDISQNRLDQGAIVMAAAGVSEEHYEALAVGGCELTELAGRKFDFVWAQSVLTHMPEADIRTMFRAIRPMMNEGAVYYFTFAPADKRRRMNIKDFWYPTEDMRRIVESEGFTFEVRDDWPGVGGAMIKTTVAV